MEKIHENVCFVVFLYENMRTCLFTYYFLHLVLTFTPHYIIMVKGLLVRDEESAHTLPQQDTPGFFPFQATCTCTSFYFIAFKSKLGKYMECVMMLGLGGNETGLIGKPGNEAKILQEINCVKQIAS